MDKINDFRQLEGSDPNAINPIFRMYWHVAENLKKENIYFLGRLAEYKYYDMDDVVKRALEVFETL